MKIRLNKCKSQLNEMPLDKWHQHTKRMNPAGTVAKRLKLEVKPELLTQVRVAETFTSSQRLKLTSAGLGQVSRNLPRVQPRVETVTFSGLGQVSRDLPRVQPWPR